MSIGEQTLSAWVGCSLLVHLAWELDFMKGSWLRRPWHHICRAKHVSAGNLVRSQVLRHFQIRNADVVSLTFDWSIHSCKCCFIRTFEPLPETEIACLSWEMHGVIQVLFVVFSRANAVDGVSLCRCSFWKMVVWHVRVKLLLMLLFVVCCHIGFAIFHVDTVWYTVADVKECKTCMVPD